MKIGIFTELYSPSIGGMEVRYKELANALTERGHKITIYCIGHTKNLMSYEEINGINVFRFPITRNYKEPLIKSLKRAIIPLIRYSFWSSKILSTEDFDFIIYNQWPLFHILTSPKKTRAHSVIDWCEIRNGKFYQLCQTFLPKITQFNMAVSPSVCEHIEKVSSQPVYFLPSGIDRKRYCSLDRDRRTSLLCIGRVAEHKNLPLLIEAFELLKDSEYQGRLILAGDGPELENIRSKISISRHRDSIDLLGLVSEEEKVRLLSEAELLVIPSKREGFPQVVAEAMASGLPIVTSDYPENGTTEILNYYGCGLVSKPDARSLSETIIAALSDWQKYSKICLNSSSELDWSLLAKSFEEELIFKQK
jgi:glycosyltransferase involved in cell wall biosynthesis